MKYLCLMLTMLFAGAMIGCESKKPPTPKPAERPEIKVNAPGVNVDVEPGKGVQVEAPGVEIDTKPKQ